MPKSRKEVSLNHKEDCRCGNCGRLACKVVQLDGREVIEIKCVRRECRHFVYIDLSGLRDGGSVKLETLS